MSLNKVSSGRDVPNDFNVIIEIPMNADPIKYEVDKESGAIFVDRFMSTAMHYPCNYGYVPNTLSDDGDPCDVLVITPFPLFPGVVVRCRHMCMESRGIRTPGEETITSAMLGELQERVRSATAQGQAWLGGAHLGPLDAYSLTLTRWGTLAGITPEAHPELWAFVQKVAAEPAVARVIERERLQLNMGRAA